MAENMLSTMFHSVGGLAAVLQAQGTKKEGTEGQGAHSDHQVARKAWGMSLLLILHEVSQQLKHKMVWDVPNHDSLLGYHPFPQDFVYKVTY